MYHSRWKGNHYEAGFRNGNTIFKHGKRPDINHLIDKEKINYSKKVYSIYLKVYPEIIEEIKGYADGLRIEFETIFAFLSSLYVFPGNTFCSCIGISNSYGIYLARNSDFNKKIRKLTDSALYTLKDTYSFLGHTSAMIQLEDGINECGLACGLTFVYPTIKGIGLNAGFLIRYILEKCATVDEARKFLENVDIGSSQNIIVVDRSGKLLLAELNPMNHYFEEVQRGALYRTNHFISKRMHFYQIDREDDIQSHLRYDTLSSKNYSVYDIEKIKRLISGEEGFLCQYKRNQEFDTIWSTIYDIKENKLYRCEGNPSRKKFVLDKRW